MLLALFGSPRRQRWLIVLLLLGGVIVAWPWLGGDVLRVHGSRAALIEQQKRAGYLLVGSFGRPEWPAIVLARTVGQGAVSFVTADGQAHQYQGFAGPMKVLHFRAGLGGGKAFTLVFHQPPKGPEDNPAFQGIR